MGWKDTAARSVAGPRHNMESLPGYWVRPRKYSVAASDEINAAAAAVAAELPPGLQARLAQMARDTGKDAADLVADLAPEDVAAIVKIRTAPTAENLRLRLRYGVAEHNFDGPDENGSDVIKSGLTPDQVDELLLYPDVAGEIVRVIEGWNRPLAQTTSSTSETSPNGSSGEPSLTVTESSPTEGGPAS